MSRPPDRLAAVPRLVGPRRLDRDLAVWARAAGAPGLAVAAVLGTDVCYAGGFGITSVGADGVPVTPETLFHIASTTKPLTGTAVMRLVERGALDLDRPVHEYLPWLRLGREDAAARVSLRMLLSHTAGLPTGRYRPVGPRAAGALERWVRRTLPRYRLVAPPGARYVYSSPGIALAGFVAEAVSGPPFADLMRELVFEPLGMRRTTFDPGAPTAGALARGHFPDGRGGLAPAPEPAVNAAQAPAGFAFSTALDLANFAIVHLNRGRFRGRPFLGPGSVAAMHATHARTGRDDADGYGLTFGTDTHGGIRVVEHDGEGGWSTSQFVLAPERRLLRRDRAGYFAALQARARAFVWDEAMQARADAFANEAMVGWIEEVHKGVAGLRGGEVGRLLDAEYGLSWGLNRLVEVQRGVPLAVGGGSADWFDALERVVGPETTWARLRRRVFGVGADDPPPLRERVVAGLRFYVATAELLADVWRPPADRLVDHAVRLVRDALGERPASHPDGGDD